jgi:hypothetical protein
MFGMMDNPVVAPAVDAFAVELVKGASAMDLVRMSKLAEGSRIRGKILKVSKTIAGIGNALKARRAAEAAVAANSV